EILNAIVQLAAEQHSILLSPMFSRPEPWTGFRKGGLAADHDWRVPLIAEHHPSIEAAVSDAITAGKMQRVLDALNYLQDTPWVINKPLLKFMQRKPRDPVAKPAAYEPWKKSNQEEWTAWQEAQAFELDLAIAETTAAADRFWQPLHFDFRGRVNPICYFNYTRADHIRALFRFANDQTIGEDGLRQLKAHVARCADGNTFSQEPKPSRLDLDVFAHCNPLAAGHFPIVERTSGRRLAWNMGPLSERATFVEYFVVHQRQFFTVPPG